MLAKIQQELIDKERETFYKNKKAKSEHKKRKFIR